MRCEKFSKAGHRQAIDIEITDGVHIEAGFSYPREVTMQEAPLVFHTWFSKVIDRIREDRDAINCSHKNSSCDSLPFQTFSTPPCYFVSHHKQAKSACNYKYIRGKNKNSCKCGPQPSPRRCRETVIANVSPVVKSNVTVISQKKYYWQDQQRSPNYSRSGVCMFHTPWFDSKRIVQNQQFPGCHGADEKESNRYKVIRSVRQDVTEGTSKHPPVSYQWQGSGPDRYAQ